MCSQEQWDIYKLDPEYDCTVCSPPLLSTITRRKGKERPSVQDDHSTQQTHLKRPLVEESSDDELPMPGKLKKTRPVEVEEYTDSDDEVEMIVDSSARFENVKKTRRNKLREGREQRRQKLATKVKKPRYEVEDLSMIDLTIDPEPPSYSQPPSYTSNPPSFSSQPPSYTSQPPSFSSQPSTNAATQTSDDRNIPRAHLRSHRKRSSRSPGEQKPSKRARLQVPEVAKKMPTRGRFRQGRYNERLSNMREVRDRDFMDTRRASVPADAFSSNSLFRILLTVASADAFSNIGSTTTRPTSPQAGSEPLPEEDPISLEEKIRRIQEMNAYEQARRERDNARYKAEAAEAERRRKQEEVQKRERERVERERREREREQERRRKHQQEEQERWQQQIREEQERKRKQQQEERYSYGPWTTQRALERYKSLAEAFDNAKFTAETPVSFATIPWPVLHKPTRFTVEDVDWSSVEAFFNTVRPHMRSQDYKVFIEKSHRRFHPDRWRARRVLQSIEDEELRACLEVAANTVAQAITPLWREVKSL